MRNCHVFHRENSHEDHVVPAWSFSGNKPALPPLTTEVVASLIYVVDDEPKK